MPSKPMELIFPLKGVNDGWGFGNQPEGTCPDALNVVPVDTLDSRIRGGQRWGTTKYYTALHNGANALQGMTLIAESTDTVADVTDTFTQANGVLDNTNWYPAMYDAYPNVDDSGTRPVISGNKIVHNNTTVPGGLAAFALHKTAVEVPGVPIELSADVSFEIQDDTEWETVDFGFVFRAPSGATMPFNVSTLNRVFFKWSNYADQTEKLDLYINGASSIGFVGVPGAGNYTDPAWWGTARNIKVSLTGNTYTFSVAGTTLGSVTVATNAGQVVVGLYVSKSDALDNEVTMDNFKVETNVSSSSRIYKLITVSGGDVYVGSPPGTLLAATDGANAVITSGRVGMQSAFGKIYFCDGVNANYSVLDLSTDTVAAWTPTDGTLPTSGTDAARYIALYRGRLVLSGLVSDPHNWFMTEAGDPLDIDYGATVSEIMAVAGNNTDAGYCPDIITCLAPYSDDMMFIGGDHTLWLMRGDPASRGRIDNISYQTGISGPDAYTFDPNGIFYFFGQGTIWRMSAGGVPEPLSRNRMDIAFNAIDLTTNTVHLAWDNVRHGLHIFVVPSASGATTHYYWDERTDGFWKISYPNDHGPTTVLAFDGDNPDDNALLLGGWDGYIRYIDPSVKNDDGVKISSHVLYPPIMAGGPLRNTRINGITAILDTKSDDVILTVYAEDTIQRAIEASTIRFARTISAGRTRILNRVAGNAIMLKLSNSVDETTWAIENLIANVEILGRTRKNQL